MSRNARAALALLGASFLLLNAAAAARGSHPRAALAFAIADIALLPFLCRFSWRAFRERRS